MIYLLSQILICLALAALLGGAIGWLLQRSRGTRRLDAAREAFATQQRQLERAQSDVDMLTDDFDDLRERSRKEIDALRQENRELPAMKDNLEKSQLVVRQILQRQESRDREQDTVRSALEERVARLQEQVVTQERRLTAAARTAGATAVTPATEPARNAGTPSFDSSSGDVPSRTRSPGDTATSDAPRAAPRDHRATTRDANAPATHHTRAADATDAPPVSQVAAIAAAAIAARVVAGESRPVGRPESAATPRPLADREVQEAGDESLDEVMEVDENFAAELREDMGAGSRGTAAGASSDARESTDNVSNETYRIDADGALYSDEDEEWDDEEANATLAIEVFSMDDLHGVDDHDPDDRVAHATAQPLFRPVDRQDDLQRLVGIGPGTEQALNDLGITSYPQLAQLRRPEIERIAAALDIVPERIEQDDWVGNARRQLEDVLEEL